MDTYFFTFIMEFSDLIKGVFKKEIKDVEILFIFDGLIVCCIRYNLNKIKRVIFKSFQTN